MRRQKAGNDEGEVNGINKTTSQQATTELTGERRGKGGKKT